MGLADTSSHRVTWIDIGIIVLLVLLCARTGLLLTRMIAAPLQAVTAALEQAAEKNLASLASELDGMIRQFRLPVPPASSACQFRLPVPSASSVWKMRANQAAGFRAKPNRRWSAICAWRTRKRQKGLGRPGPRSNAPAGGLRSAPGPPACDPCGPQRAFIRPGSPHFLSRCMPWHVSGAPAPQAPTSMEPLRAVVASG